MFTSFELINWMRFKSYAIEICLSLRNRMFHPSSKLCVSFHSYGALISNVLIVFCVLFWNWHPWLGISRWIAKQSIKSHSADKLCGRSTGCSDIFERMGEFGKAMENFLHACLKISRCACLLIRVCHYAYQREAANPRKRQLMNCIRFFLFNLFQN